PTLAAPKAAAIWPAFGLQGRTEAAPKVITGLVVSLVKVTVCDAVPVLLQSSVTVHDLVTLQLQPVPATSEPTVPVATNPGVQLSLTLAAPKAAAIWSALGLQGRTEAAPKVITGLVVSLVKVTVCRSEERRVGTA